MTDNVITSGAERAIIEKMLDGNRAALIETVRGLSEADARRRLVASLTTPISLIKHAAGAERIWFQRFWAGLDESECDGYSRRDEGTFVVTDDESLADVIAEFDIPAIKDAGYVLVTPLVITNAKKLTTAVRDAQTPGASVAVGDNLLQVGHKEKTSA